MVRDTPPSQDVSTYQIWNPYLKESRRYAPDMKQDGLTEGRTDSASTICLPKFLWGLLRLLSFANNLCQQFGCHKLGQNVEPYLDSNYLTLKNFHNMQIYPVCNSENLLGQTRPLFDLAPSSIDK